MGRGITGQAIELAEYRLVTRERPLGLALARSDGMREDVLLPQRVLGSESICGGFAYRILCVADDAGLALKDFIGVPAELRIVTDRGQLRRVCGIVTEAVSGQSDGALATYRLVIRDAMSVMEGRSNTRHCRWEDGRSDPVTRRKNSATASVPSTASRSPTPAWPTCGAARSTRTKSRPAPPMRC